MIDWKYTHKENSPYWSGEYKNFSLRIYRRDEGGRIGHYYFTWASCENGEGCDFGMSSGRFEDFMTCERDAIRYVDMHDPIEPEQPAQLVHFREATPNVEIANSGGYNIEIVRELGRSGEAREHYYRWYVWPEDQQFSNGCSAMTVDPNDAKMMALEAIKHLKNNAEPALEDMQDPEFEPKLPDVETDETLSFLSVDATDYQNIKVTYTCTHPDGTPRTYEHKSGEGWVELMTIEELLPSTADPEVVNARMEAEEEKREYIERESYGGICEEILHAVDFDEERKDRKFICRMMPDRSRLYVERCWGNEDEDLGPLYQWRFIKYIYRHGDLYKTINTCGQRYYNTLYDAKLACIQNFCEGEYSEAMMILEYLHEQKGI